MFLGEGLVDPHLNTAGDIYFRFQYMIKAWKKKDPPHHCIKLIPIQVIQHIADIVEH